MPVFSKDEISLFLTEKTMELYQSYSDVIAYVTENKICCEKQTTTLCVDSLARLMEVFFKSLTPDDVLRVCGSLHINACYSEEDANFSLTLLRPHYQLGSIVASTEIEGVDMCVIKGDDGLLFCVDSSYVEQDVDVIKSPYGNGVVVLR